MALLWTLLVLQMWVSLKWRMEHDAALIHYVAFLMDHEGRMPYKDVFQTDMPGTFAFHYAIGHFFGFDDRAFRRVDLAFLSVLLAATWAFMRRFGHRPALAACAVFGLFYLSLGQPQSLQRDYLGLLPIATALVLQPTGPARESWWRFSATGFLFGLSALFKPQLAVGLPVLLWGLSRGSSSSWNATLGRAASGAAGFLAALLVAAAWLWRNGALGAFLDMVVHYLPLHNTINGDMVVLSGADVPRYLLEHTWQFGGFRWLLLPAVVGLVLARYLTRDSTPLRSSITMLMVLAAVYALYPTIGGKFWPYHYLPTLYVLSLVAGLSLMDAAASTGRHTAFRTAATAAFVIALGIQLDLPDYGRRVLTGLRADYAPPSPKFGRVDRVSAWLSSHANKGDVAQPLDWNGGMLHAMLVARIPLATSFTYDYHFYHHASLPVIQALRTRFIRELRASPPRFILKVTALKPFVHGVDTTSEFPELSDVLQAYRPVTSGNGFTIYERPLPSTHASLTTP